MNAYDKLELLRQAVPRELHELIYSISLDLPEEKLKETDEYAKDTND